MPSADQIRKSLEVRIEHLKRELRQPRGGAHRADHEEGHRMTRPASEGIPPSVLRVFEEWDAGDRLAQAAAAWQRARWLAAMPKQARVLEALPDRLDRSTVRRLVLQKKPLTASGMFEAMVIVYAWGWSMSSVGVTRAQTAIRAGIQPLGSALLPARDAVQTRGPLAVLAA